MPSRRTMIRTGALAGVGGLLAACSSPSTPTGGPATTSPAGSSRGPAAPFVLDDTTKPKIDALFDQVAKSTGIAGMAGGIWMSQTVWQRATGFANLDQQTPFDPGGNVRIASITKSFVATGVLQLIDAGAVKLDDVLERYVPGIANGSSITVKNLLGMTSGIYDFTSDPEFTRKFDANPALPWSFQDTLGIIKANKPAFAPGAKLTYCDSNYAILGEILGMVAGQPARTVVADSIAVRLGLAQTVWPIDSALPDPHPTGYVPTGLDPAKPQQPFDNAGSPPKVVDAVNPDVPAGAGAMISRLDDLRIWGKEIATGTLLKPATQAERLQYQPFANVPVRLGYGLGCERLNDFTGHNGAIYGFSSVVFHNPTVGLTLAVVGNESTNFTTPTATFAYLFIRQFFPDQWR